MTTTPDPTQTFTTQTPITFTVDMDQFVRHIYTAHGYAHWDDEEGAHSLDGVLGQAVDRLVTSLRKSIAEEVVKQAREIIRDEVADIVKDTLSATYQPVNEFGRATGSPINIRDQIANEAKTWWSKTDGYSSGRGNGQKFVASEVDAAMKAELKATVEENKTLIIARMKDVAAQLLADAATKG